MTPLSSSTPDGFTRANENWRLQLFTYQNMIERGEIDQVIWLFNNPKDSAQNKYLLSIGNLYTDMSIPDDIVMREAFSNRYMSRTLMDKLSFGMVSEPPDTEEKVLRMFKFQPRSLTEFNQIISKVNGIQGDRLYPPPQAYLEAGLWKEQPYQISDSKITFSQWPSAQQTTSQSITEKMVFFADEAEDISSKFNTIVKDYFGNKLDLENDVLPQLRDLRKRTTDLSEMIEQSDIFQDSKDRWNTAMTKLEKAITNSISSHMSGEELPEFIYSANNKVMTTAEIEWATSAEMSEEMAQTTYEMGYTDTYRVTVEANDKAGKAATDALGIGPVFSDEELKLRISQIVTQIKSQPFEWPEEFLRPVSTGETMFAFMSGFIPGFMVGLGTGLQLWGNNYKTYLAYGAAPWLIQGGVSDFLINMGIMWGSIFVSVFWGAISVSFALLITTIVLTVAFFILGFFVGLIAAYIFVQFADMTYSICERDSPRYYFTSLDLVSNHTVKNGIVQYVYCGLRCNQEGMSSINLYYQDQYGSYRNIGTLQQCHTDDYRCFECNASTENLQAGTTYTVYAKTSTIGVGISNAATLTVCPDGYVVDKTSPEKCVYCIDHTEVGVSGSGTPDYKYESGCGADEACDEGGAATLCSDTGCSVDTSVRKYCCGSNSCSYHDWYEASCSNLQLDTCSNCVNECTGQITKSSCESNFYCKWSDIVFKQTCSNGHLTNTNTCGQDCSGSWTCGGGTMNGYSCLPNTCEGKCKGYCDSNCNPVSYSCDTTCGSAAECQGRLPGNTLSTCNKAGQTYFADACSDGCQLQDSIDKICRSSSYGSGCTADPLCNGIMAGTNNCDLNCRFNPGTCSGTSVPCTSYSSQSTCQNAACTWTPVTSCSVDTSISKYCCGDGSSCSYPDWYEARCYNLQLNSCSGCVVHCSGTTQSSCRSEFYCKWTDNSYCSGTQQPCSTFTNSNSCNAVSGCSWSYVNICVDTDNGINQWTGGNVTGYNNGQFYSYLDYCIDGVNIMEYNCANNNYANRTINCMNSGMYYYCDPSRRACVYSPGYCNGTSSPCTSYSSQSACQNAGCSYSSSGHCTMDTATYPYCCGYDYSCDYTGWSEYPCEYYQTYPCYNCVDWCSSYNTQSSCESYDYCNWIGSTSCSGTPRPCSNYTNAGLCGSASGCSWKRRSGGGGCPFLKVWDGKKFKEVEKLNIHASEDVTYASSFSMEPRDGKYEIILHEEEKGIYLFPGSHIDSVKLIDENGTECRLVSAVHSKQGDVLNQLEKSDDVRVNTLPEEEIKLVFDGCSGENFSFVIEGYNYKMLLGTIEIEDTTLYAIIIVIALAAIVFLAFALYRKSAKIGKSVKK